MYVPTPKRKRITRQEILDWIHFYIDKNDETAGSRLLITDLVQGAGPEGCNWVWNQATSHKSGPVDPTARFIVDEIVMRAQARFLLDDGPAAGSQGVSAQPKPPDV